VRASAIEHGDLFWGLRGAGGGLGVVTSFEFHLRPQHEVLAGFVVHPAKNAQSVLRAFRDFASQAPDEFCGLAVMCNAPPLPFLEPEWYERPVIILAICWCGDISAGARSLAVLRHFGSPLADQVESMQYVRWQHMHDVSASPYRFQYWKTASFSPLADEVIDTLAAAAENLPTPMTSIHIQHFGGAVARSREVDTAFAQRGTQFFVNLMGTCPWSGELAHLREHIRRLNDQIEPKAIRSLLLPNFTDQDDGDVATHLGSSAAERIASLRRLYDPAGLFSASHVLRI
jgi:hypothetical protein